MSDRSVRIGCASAFWGDTETAAAQLVEHGRLDYLVFDYLSEITLSIMAAQKLQDPTAGYARDFIEVLAPLLPAIRAQNLKVVSNAGGINPLACRDALARAAEQAGLSLRIAVVLGDDLMPQLPGARAQIREWRSGEPLPALVLSANAYLGARPIRDALAAGADIVLTGRCVDSAVTLGPLMHEFGWSSEDYARLAAGALAGHLIECGTQVCGGNFTDWRDVPGYEAMGFPIVEVRENGEFIVTKPDATGGLVTPATVAEQLVYEIDDPANYRLPDVCADWRGVHLTDLGNDRVRVEGARGRAPGPDYKVSATYPDGFRCTALFMIGGIDAVAKGERVASALLEKTRRLLKRKGLGDYRRVDVEILGAEASYGVHARRADTREVVVKIATAHSDKRALVLFSREIAQAATAMAPGITGYAGGRPLVHPMVRLYSFFWPKSALEIQLDIAGERIPVPAECPSAPAETPSTEPEAPSQASPREPVSASVPLLRLAHARSGDKGDDANIGVIARRPEFLPWLRAALTCEAVARYFSHLSPTAVERYELPGIQALNFVLRNALGGGGVASLRMDPQGKALAQMLLDIAIPVSESIIESLMEKETP